MFHVPQFLYGDKDLFGEVRFPVDAVGEEEEEVADVHRSRDDQLEGDGDESDRSSDDDFWSAGASSDMFVGRVNALCEALVDRGVIEVIPGADASGACALDVRYIRPDPFPVGGQQQSHCLLYTSDAADD